jgi:hypothetical protein
VFLNAVTDEKAEEIDNAFPNICQNNAESCDISPLFAMHARTVLCMYLIGMLKWHSMCDISTSWIDRVLTPLLHPFD